MTTIQVFKHVNVNNLQLHKLYTLNIQLLTYMHNTAGSNIPNQVTAQGNHILNCVLILVPMAMFQ